MAALLECSLHGVENSIIAAHPCPCFCNSCMVESDRQYSLRMAEYAREIRELCAKILELLQEEIDATEQLNDTAQISDEMLPSLTDVAQSLNQSPEVLNEAFPVVDSSNSNIVLKGPLPSVVDRIDFGEKETIIDGDNKHRNSSVMINTWVFNLVMFTQPYTLQTDPPDQVPVPPPPLAPPWLHHLIYPGPLALSPFTPSQFDNPIALQVINMLRENSISNASIITHVFCPMVFPLLTVGGFIDFGTSASYTYQLFVERPLNITFSCNMVLFQDMKTLVTQLETSSLDSFNLTLDTVLFACDNVESLIVEMQRLASFVQDYFNILVECKEHFYCYFIGFASEFSVVTLALTKLVDNGVCLFKTQQLDLSEKMVHASLRQLALIVSHVTRLEYSVICVYLVGLVYGSCSWQIQLAIIVDHDECEKATLFNIGLASKTDLIFIGVGNNVSMGEIITTLEIAWGKYACTRLFNASPSGLELEFDFLANVGSSVFPRDPYFNDACSSSGIYPNYNVSCYDLVSHFNCCQTKLPLVFSSAYDQYEFKGWKLSFWVVELIGQLKQPTLVSIQYAATYYRVVVYDFIFYGVLECKVMSLQHSFDDVSGNHNAYSGFKHMNLEHSVISLSLAKLVVNGGKATLSQDAHIPYGSHESSSTIITQAYNSHNYIYAHLLFHPVLVCGPQLNVQDMPNLWLPRTCSEHANLPWPQIVQLVDVSIWLAAVLDSFPKVVNGFITTFSAYSLVPSMSIAKYLQMTPKGRHSKKWDPGGVANFFIIKGVLQFKKWDLVDVILFNGMNNWSGSYFKGYSVLMLTTKEVNAFICEFSIFQNVEYKLWDPGGGCFIVHVEVATIIILHHLDFNCYDSK